LRVLYKDKAGNVLTVEGKKLAARNSKGQLVDTAGLKTMMRKAVRKKIKLKYYKKGKKEFMEMG